MTVQPNASLGGKPDSNLIMAIITTVLCCVPVGGYAIYLAIQSDQAWKNGDAATAAEFGAKARQFSIYAVIAGLVVGVLWGISSFVLGGAGSS